MTADLLPCPFCGGKAAWFEIEATGDGGVECTACHASSPVEFIFRDNMADYWNTRAAPTLAAALALPEVAALVEALRKIDVGEGWAAQIARAALAETATTEEGK